MKCSVVFSDGRKVDGNFSGNKENFSVGYILDGDKCVLNYSDGVLTQKRTGSVTLGLVFIRGEESVCTVGEGEMSGTLPVFCEELEIVFGSVVRISLAYLLGGERMTLQINIDF